MHLGWNGSTWRPADSCLKVGAFTAPGADRGLQQYVIAPYNRVVKVDIVVLRPPSSHRSSYLLKVPEGISQVDAAAVIDNFICAWWTITKSFGLPLPESIPATQAPDPALASTPILLWGGGTGAAIYAIQVLKLAGYKKIITTTSAQTAAAAKAFGATDVFNYNDEGVVRAIKEAAGGPIKYALDPVCTKTSLEKIAEIVEEPGSKVAVLIPIKAGSLTNLSDRGAELLPNLPDHLNPLKKGVEAVPTCTFLWEEVRPSRCSSPLRRDFMSGSRIE